MNQMEENADIYLTQLENMEQTWKEAVDQAMAVREGQLAMAYNIIVELQQQVKTQQSLLRGKSEEVDAMTYQVTNLTEKLAKCEEEVATLKEEKERILEEQTLELGHIQETREKEREDMRQRYKLSIQELTGNARDTLLELESQLEAAKRDEALCRKKVLELEDRNALHEKHLKDWNNVSDRMSDELSEMKKRLQSSKYANCNLRKELDLWKSYCHKAEEERKALRREIDLEKKVLHRFSQVDAFLRSERQQRNMVLEAMNYFGKTITKDIQQLQSLRLSPIVLNSVEVQTDPCEDAVKETSQEKDKTIAEQTQRVKHLQDELTTCCADVEGLKQQNTTLREVIKAMRKERENWEKEKVQIEEEARVTKLEESVRLLKNNMMDEQKEMCVWNALQEVKKEVSHLKSKSKDNRGVKQVTENESSSFPNPKFVLKTVAK